MRWFARYRAWVLFAVSAVLLGIGGLAWLASWHAAADAVWFADTVLGLLMSSVMVAAAIRRRQPSVDVIAVLALVGALAVGEPFAGAVITVMLTSGQLLEARAESRARRDLSALAQRAPRTARRRSGDGMEVVAVDEVAVGDRLVVGAGEVVPVDGRLMSAATLDESAMTGESRPVDRVVGDDVRSGVVNAAEPFELVATRRASESTYAGLVRLVEQAQAASAPFVRVADRVAVFFVPLTLVVAGAAWVLSSDAVRAVAVLVVATPCPLLLAAPIAIMSGMSRAARVGVLVKGGAALERLAVGRVVLFDKTGTLTLGKPQVTDLAISGDVPADDVLSLAASLDQVSPHVLASAIVSAAGRRGLPLQLPTGVREVHGFGVEGTVDDRQVRLGKASWIVGQDPPQWARQVQRRADVDGALTVFMAIDDRPVGAFLLTDAIRLDAPRMVRALRAAGVSRVVLLTGDRADTAQIVGRIVGVDSILANCTPAEKLAAIERESARAPTIMVGDGVNDAPALAAAGAGVALAAGGATASSEAADVVLTVDRVDALADAILIARRSRTIAMRAVVVGMGLSLVAMLAASFGLLPPPAGALLQEAIDVLAIGIALLALVPGRMHTIALPAADVELARRLRTEHDAILPLIDQIRVVADALSTSAPDLAPCRVLLTRLEDELVPHERTDEAVLVPMVARALGGVETTAATSRTHAEIEQQVAQLHRLLTGLKQDEVVADDVVELRRLLYGLYAILRLHNAQEEEQAFSLVPDVASSDQPLTE